MDRTSSPGGVVMESPSSSRGAEAGETEAQDPMFVIKNLDTGLEMRIDDFDRIAHIATDPDPDTQEPQPGHKKSGLMKGTKAFKHWTQAQAKKAQATAKKAVSTVKEVAHVQQTHVQQVLAKHKLPNFETSPSGRDRDRATTEGGPHPSETPRPLLATLELLRRSTGETSNAAAAAAAAAAHEAEVQRSGSLASVSIPASSDVSITSQGSGKQHSLPPAAAADSGAAGGAASRAAADTSLPSPAPAAAAAAAAAAAVFQPISMHVSQLLTPRSETGSAPGSSTAGLMGLNTAAAAAAAPSVPQPVVPAVVRLMSHKASKRPYEAVVLAQVLGTTAGVVWVVAASQDGAFLATAGQDCVLCVWQLTASKSKHPRTNWVYSSSSSSSCADAAQDGHSAAHAGAGGDLGRSSSSGQQQAIAQQQGPPLPEQAAEHAGAQDSREAGSGIQQETTAPGSPGALQQQQHAPSMEQQHSQEQAQQGVLSPPPQQQQQQQSQPEQPPVIEFGAYYSRTPVRQYCGHGEDILDVSWSPSGGFLLSASLDKSVRLWHLSQPECLRAFEHSDFVTSVQFHPSDAQRFVSGSIDGKIRVWSIMDSSVIATVQLHQDMVTAVSFSLNGSRVMAGTMRGRVRFYDLADGKLEYVAQVDVRNQRGQHASGKKVTSIAAVPGQPQQFLITTNDSRLRLLEGYGQVLKFKGHRNSSTQARAALSPDGAQLACGSDDGCLYLWQRDPSGSASSGGAAAADAGAGARGGAQQRGGGADRARSMAAAAAAQYQHLMSKNASYQAFQAHDPGQPVTAVAFVPPAAAGLPKLSVMLNSGTAGAGGGAAAAEAVHWDSRKCFVQQLVVSAGFNGSIRVHELLGSRPR